MLFLSRLVTDAMMRRCTRQLNYFITMYPTLAVWPPLWCILASIRLLSMEPAKPTAQGPGKRSGYAFLLFSTVTETILSCRIPCCVYVNSFAPMCFASIYSVYIGCLLVGLLCLC